MFGTPTDESLARKAARGNHDAYEQLVVRYEKRIYNFGLRMTGNREDAMDLMQNTFIGMYQSLPSFREDATFSTWMFSIAARKATDLYRRRKPTEQLAEEEQLPVQDLPHESPLGQLLTADLKSLIQSALTQLPTEQRLVIELKFYQELTFEEIATLLQISTNTLKSRLYTALRKIRSLTEVHHAL